MAIGIVPGFISQCQSLVAYAQHNYAITFYSTVILSFVWLFWRIYKFHWLPAQHPDDPRELPYVVPYFGHAVPFFKNSFSFLVRARDAVGTGKSPFAVTFFGNTFYIITHAKHATEMDKNTETLSFEEFVSDFVRAAGSSEDGLKASFFNKLSMRDTGFKHPSEEPMSVLIRHMHVHQLHPGDQQRILEGRFLESFDRELRLDSIPNERPYLPTVEVSLYQWCATFFSRAGEYAYFGNSLSAVDPDFSKMFYVFDELSWQITYNIPALFAKSKVSAQSHLQESLKRYFQIPQSDRDETAWFTKVAENGFRAAGISDDDMATFFLTIYLTINTNTRRSVFWMLTHLLHNPSLIEIVRNETAEAFEGGTLVHPRHIFDHEACPYLEAIWLETLRVSSSGSSVRNVNSDTMIGGKLLRKGNKILVPFRLLHLDESVYGEDAHLFKPQRFLNKGTRSLTGNWRPFGGGKTICTGRYVAEHTIKMCIAIILRRFDLAIIGNGRLPQGDEGTPGLGIMGIKSTEDFLVRVTQRL